MHYTCSKYVSRHSIRTVLDAYVYSKFRSRSTILCRDVWKWYTSEYLTNNSSATYLPRVWKYDADQCIQCGSVCWTLFNALLNSHILCSLWDMSLFILRFGSSRFLYICDSRYQGEWFINVSTAVRKSEFIISGSCIACWILSSIITSPPERLPGLPPRIHGAPECQERPGK